MFYGICYLALFVELLFVCSCAEIRSGEQIRSGEPGRVDYVLELNWEGWDGTNAPPPGYAVLDETLWVAEPALDGPILSHLVKAHAWRGKSSDIRCNVPRLPNISIPPGWVEMIMSPMIVGFIVGTSEQYRLSVFCPGYRIETCYPLGMYHSPPVDSCKGEERSTTGWWDCPALLDGGFHTIPVTNRSVQVLLGCAKQDDGVYHSTLPLRKVTSGTTYFDVCAKYRTVLSRVEDGADSASSRALFGFQVASLASAISKGMLDGADREVRDIMLEAIRQQHDAIAEKTNDAFPEAIYGPQHVGTFDDCARREGSPCMIVTKWALEPRRSK